MPEKMQQFDMFILQRRKSKVLCRHTRYVNSIIVFRILFIACTGRRDIEDLRVKCSNLERSCKWEGTVGTLRDHLAKCDFALLPCPKGCSEKVLFLRKDLKQHLEKRCPKRPYSCKHCGKKGEYAAITGRHDSVCLHKRVPCINKSIGCSEVMERRLRKRHLEELCPFTEIQCRYADIGCGVKKQRREMQDHEENSTSHLEIALKTLSDLKEENKKLQKWSDILQSNTTFSVTDYEERFHSDLTYTSPSFYTSVGNQGYKMSLDVVFRRDRQLNEDYIKVYANIESGVNDDLLKWPFLGKVHFILLNQLEDRNHHIKTALLTTRENARSDESWGYDHFIRCSALGHDPVKNTQFLKYDTLYFRVSVEVDDHKPWLQCRVEDDWL